VGYGEGGAIAPAPCPHSGQASDRGGVRTQEEEEERSLIVDLKRHTQLAVAWNRHGSLVPRWT